MTMGEANDTFKLIVLRHGQSELNHENIFCGWIDAKLTEKGKDQARNTAKLIKDYCLTNNVKLPEIGYTSRLVRTEQTMDVILEELGISQLNKFKVTGSVDSDDIDKFFKESRPTTIPVLQTWRLNERHYGSWQGQRKPNILEKYGKDEYMYIRRDYHGKPPQADLKREMVQEKNDLGSATGYEFKEPNRNLKYRFEEDSKEKLPDSESLSEVVKRLNPFLENVVFKISQIKNQSSCLIVGHGSSVRSVLKILQNISDEDIKDIDIPNGIPLVIELEKNTNKFIKCFYLDPESAKVNAEKVRNEGFVHNP
ncbi:hypothetical protein TBLA_0G00870 [Henningerozyma blattae CBS 6284]|uniref:Phosphoglycerate mutase n=1 Tax=Henningerozyma blattae (strain ATCC 34711 / CBS 6284 / DSM 70876 / NBRC 10599 / NRRL Y-10934 / UCD 77-7) TaxID=1071380 RepID=I2H6N2_HENB6|nr:hypothetical protein TBLA_0G00870 [Tetrapisispora blattae CBS 6284]CCH62034.1 hypothetical protein TBLA_0G00870 [Tetrapisispora blattae CBS 6284]